jgi:hypothetical protein
LTILNPCSKVVSSTIIDYGHEDRIKVGESRGNMGAIVKFLTLSYRKPDLYPLKTNRSARRYIRRYRFKPRFKIAKF